MLGDVLRRLDFAQHIFGAATDAVVVDFRDLDFAFRVDEEGATVGDALAFNHHVEATRQHAGRVAQHRVPDLADGRAVVVPRLVGEVGVAGNGIDFDAEALQLGVVFGHVFQLGRADEGKIRRIEQENGPFALDVFMGDGLEFAVVEGLHGKFGNTAVDDGHDCSWFTKKRCRGGDCGAYYNQRQHLEKPCNR